MNLQRLIKICGGLGSSVVLLAGLNGCSSTNGPAPISQANPGNPSSASFASSTVCANNAFLQKYQCSFPRVEQAARAGDPDAQYALGYLYYYGIGATQDRQTGLMWIRKAAAQGQPVAQEALKDLSAATSTTAVVPKSAPTQAITPSTAPSSNSSGNSVQSSNNQTSNANTSTSTNTATGTTTSQAKPDKPLTDYLPNYGEKRVDTTSTPPLINLSTQPAAQN